VYCQLGRTFNRVNHWEKLDFPNTDEIIEYTSINIEKNHNLDYITVSGSGEPTLNPDLGDIADRIHAITDFPLALITNSSLLIHGFVLDNAKKFDLILPSLDAGDNKTFKAINRPEKGFDIDEIVNGIKQLKLRSKGKIWLEVMLIKGKVTNTTNEQIDNIMGKISEIHPHKVFLNSPTRPPSETWIEPLSYKEMNTIKSKMEDNLSKDVEIENASKKAPLRYKAPTQDDVSNKILRMLAIRPCSLRDISSATGLNPNEAIKYLDRLLDNGQIFIRISNDEAYYMRLLK
jgi:wyosine [tRNA(Phe)-imidazoG37] synthetase (radical SAM superfamily)